MVCQSNDCSYSMKKHNSLNYEIVKSMFDLTAPGEQGGSYFRINGGKEPVLIPIPTSLMHRLYRLGQAYGIRQFRYFENETKIVVGSAEVPEFVTDLIRLRALVNDEVLHEWIDKLISEIESPPGAKSKHIAVSTGSFFERRD